MAFVEFGFYSGVPAGILAGGYLFPVVGYVGIFAISTAIRFFCLVYVVSASFSFAIDYCMSQTELRIRQMLRIGETRGPRACQQPPPPSAEEDDQGPAEDQEGANRRPLFHPSHAIQVLKTCFRRRGGHDRAIIMMLVASMLLFMATACERSP